MNIYAPRALSVGLTGFLVLLTVTLLLAARAPYLGVNLAPGAQGISVLSVDPNGPAAAVLRPGDELLAINADNTSLALLPSDSAYSLDTLNSHIKREAFFSREAQLWQAVHAERVGFRVLRGAQILDVHLQPAEDRRLNHLSGVFWYQLICASLIMLLSVMTYAFATHERGPQLYALAGTSIAMAIMACAIYSTRELAFSPMEFLVLARTHQLGMLLFVTFGSAMMWYYPTRLGRRSLVIWLPAAALLVGLIGYIYSADDINHLVRLLFVSCFLLNVFLAYCQWRRTTDDPVQRARLKWLVSAWFIGISGYILLISAPQLSGYLPIIRPAYGWGLFVITYLGIALGIVKFRLFDLDRWILSAWLWFFCGVCFVAFDLILIYWLHAEASISLFITAAVAAWTYFPIRQWLFARVTAKSRVPPSTFLPSIIGHLFDQTTKGSMQVALQRALENSFVPLHIRLVNAPLATSTFSENGLELHVPSATCTAHFVLSHADLGGRLFRRSDADTADSISQLFIYAQRLKQARKEGISAERERLAADLHDDIGSRLLNIVYSSNEPSTVATARETLASLRVAMQDLQEGGAKLTHVMDYWRRENIDRCQLAGMTPDFLIDPSIHSIVISATQRSQLTRVVRELVSNAISHSGASRLRFHFFIANSTLSLRYQDDGIGMHIDDVTNANSGMGLGTMRQRIESIGGHMTLEPTPTGTSWLFSIPQPDPDPHD